MRDELLNHLKDEWNFLLAEHPLDYIAYYIIITNFIAYTLLEDIILKIIFYSIYIICYIYSIYKPIE